MSDRFAAKKAGLKEIIAIARKASAGRLKSKYAQAEQKHSDSDLPTGTNEELLPKDKLEESDANVDVVDTATPREPLSDESADEVDLEGLPGTKRRDLKGLLKRMR